MSETNQIQEKNLIELAKILKDARKNKNLTVRELAEKSDMIIASEVSMLENARRKKPDPLVLKAFANALELNYLELYKILGYYDGDDVLSPVNLESQIPVYSCVFAGVDGHLEFGELLEYISTTHIKNTEEVFGIKVMGDSMLPTIPEDSTILIKRDSEVNEGSIGVFIVNNKPLLKRYKKQGEYVLLISDNNAYEPIIINKHDEFFIVGKVIQMITQFY